jgi:LPS sulfotransferase NodH
MNNRWCIVGLPRTGSNYLEEMLFKSIMSQQSTLVVRLGEILHRTIWNYTDSADDGFRLVADHNSNLRKNFKNELINKMKSDPSIGAVVRVFSQTHHNLGIDYKDFLNTLHSLNFKFIHLIRNQFDSVISLSTAQHTNLWHRLIVNNAEIIDGNHIYAKNPTKINIPISLIATNFVEIKLHDYYNKENLKDFEYTGIRYENMLEDCRTNNVPIQEQTEIKKLYDQSYSELIENYDEIERFYKELTSNG